MGVRRWFEVVYYVRTMCTCLWPCKFKWGDVGGVVVQVVVVV